MTVQAPLVRDGAQDVVWDEARAKVEEEWVDHLQQDLAEVVYAPTVGIKSLML